MAASTCIQPARPCRPHTQPQPAVCTLKRINKCRASLPAATTQAKAHLELAAGRAGPEGVTEPGRVAEFLLAAIQTTLTAGRQPQRCLVTVRGEGKPEVRWVTWVGRKGAHPWMCMAMQCGVMAAQSATQCNTALQQPPTGPDLREVTICRKSAASTPGRGP